MNPFISFCLYVAARVFVQYLKSRPKDGQIRASLQFLLQAMQAIKRKNPLTESFLVQLDVDLEGAGIEDTKGIRAQAQSKAPFIPNRSEGCPSEHLHMGHQTTYGDIGLAAYNNPNASGTQTTSAPSQHTNQPTSQPQAASAFGAFAQTGPNEIGDDNMGFIPSSIHQFELPNRQRSPGSSNQSTGMHRTPQSFNADMDMSPDGSSAEHRTPNSSTQSQHNLSTHTSNTGYSPQNMQQHDQSSRGMQTEPGRLSGPSLFDPNDGTFSTDFNIHDFPAGDNQQQGFVLPSNWGAGGTGFTPGPSGLTPAASGIGDMLGMSDADWNQMMDSMNFNSEWDNGVGGNTEMHYMQGRRT